MLAITDMRKEGMPFRVPSSALLAMWRARAYKLTPQEAVRMAAIKGAYEAHKVIRASGRVPGEEARAAALANCVNRTYGAGDGNRTHVRRLGSSEQNSESD